MTTAIVPTIIPAIETAEMMLMMFCFFFENKYRRAMKSGRFTVLKTGCKFSFMEQLVYVINVIQTIVDKKIQLGNNPHIFSNSSSQLTPD